VICTRCGSQSDASDYLIGLWCLECINSLESKEYKMEDQDTKIPLAAAMRAKAQESINTFDDRLYTRLRNEMVETIEGEAHKGNSIVQISHQLKNKQVNRNVLNQLKSSFIDAGYLVTYSEESILMDEQIKGRFSISWM